VAYDDDLADRMRDRVGGGALASGETSDLTDASSVPRLLAV